MMAQIFKIKFEDTLRRISVPAEGFSYNDLELRIRDLFQISNTFKVILIYTDRENDAVIMANDQDLKDACLVQNLNPLKLEVKTMPLQTGIETKLNEPGFNTTEFNVEALIKGLLPESTAKAIDQVLSRYPPCLFTTVPAQVLPEALDTFLGTLAASNGENATQLQSGDRIAVPAGVAVHKNIECDNCALCPIVGPRYKSIKKHDYDLCSRCFKTVGNALDYRKLDRPLTLQAANQPRPFSSTYGTYSSRCPFRGVFPKPNIAIKDLKGLEMLLDAEFVTDVTILDGSKVEVGSTFTKVWRLKNRGALPWPQHTKLAHVGGNMLGSNGLVTLKLPEDGLPSGGELDISVKLKAPDIIGQYVANWRLMAPSGQMFGHSVWVLIEAVPVFDKSQSLELEQSHVDGKELKDFLSEVLKIGDSILNDANGGEEGDMADCGSGKVDLEAVSVLPNLEEQHEENDGFSLVESLGNILGEKHEAVVGFELGNRLGEECEAIKEFKLGNRLGEECQAIKEFELGNRLGEECEAIEEFELVGSFPHELSTVLGIKQNDAKVEPHQNWFIEDDYLTSNGWDHMWKELEELGQATRNSCSSVKAT